MLKTDVVKYHYKFFFAKIYRKYCLLEMELLNHLYKPYATIDIVQWFGVRGKELQKIIC